MSTTVRETGETMAATLARELRGCVAAPAGVAPPVAILFTDPAREWLALRDVLLAELPELVILGEYDPDQRTGPALWLRCLVERSLDDPELPPDLPPILLLPGVARQHLRAGEDCAPALRPLVELMYRGTLWLHAGRDWSVSAFLTSAQGLGLDIARDEGTKAALGRAIAEIALTPLPQLRGRRLDAEDFDRLLSPDPVRNVLRWMSDPEGTRTRLGENGWGAFASRCREQFGFDPEGEPDVAAGALLGAGEGPWGEVWRRFTEAPSSYPGIAALLHRSRPGGTLPLHREPWPDLNESSEDEARRELRRIGKASHDEACSALIDLDRRHAERRDWVWARLGLSPVARVLEPLARLATAAAQALGGTDPDEIAKVYAERGWQADAAAWEAVAMAPTADEALVGRVVANLLAPWLDTSARAFQKALERSPLPTPREQGVVEAGDDGCVLFSDGLRYDLAERLAERLEGRGLCVVLARRWAAAPTVTASGKPAVTPVADRVRGSTLEANFGATLTPGNKPADAKNLRAALEERGYQILGTGEFDAPMSTPAKGWLEFGDIDTRGHQVGGRLARYLDEELDRLVERIASLLNSGWKHVRVVTDHGWLLLPGGLPKVDLPKHLTESRWARCAVLSPGAQPDVLRHAWSWNAAESFAYAPGIACFNKAPEYAHGGLSIQECLIPELFVERTEPVARRLAVASVTWRGLRCFLEIDGGGDGLVADLRLESPSGASVVASAKPVDADGTVSLVLADDEHEGAELVLVLVDESGQILAQYPTRVGANS